MIIKAKIPTFGIAVADAPEIGGLLKSPNGEIIKMYSRREAEEYLADLNQQIGWEGAGIRPLGTIEAELEVDGEDLVRMVAAVLIKFQEGTKD